MNYIAVQEGHFARTIAGKGAGFVQALPNSGRFEAILWLNCPDSGFHNAGQYIIGYDRVVNEVLLGPRTV